MLERIPFLFTVHGKLYNGKSKKGKTYQLFDIISLFWFLLDNSWMAYLMEQKPNLIHLLTPETSF